MARLSTTIRLALAAALALVSLGLVWRVDAGTPGMFMGGLQLTNQYNPYTGNLDLVTQYNPISNYLPGSPGAVVYGNQVPMRVVLVPAAVALLVASRLRGRAGRRLARLAVIGLTVATAFALAERATSPAIACAVAVALAGSTLWSRTARSSGVSSPASASRVVPI